MSGYSVNSPVTRRLLGALALSALALGAVGCSKDSSNSTSVTGGTVHPMQCPTGTVVGVVEDNNGHPIQGATVAIPDGATACGSSGGSSAKALLKSLTSAKTIKVHGKSVPVKASVTTDAAGQFSIPNVTVTNVANSSGSFTGHLPLDLVVVGPSGGSVSYVGATVEVNPQAQVVGDLPPFSSDTNPALIFVQGFTANTGVVQLPAMTTTVKGILRDTTSGTPVATQSVTLDFLAFTPDNGFAEGVVVTYDQPLLNTTTGSDGSFEFDNVADDSCFRLAVAGWSVSPVNEPAGFDCEDADASDPNSFSFSTINESAHSVLLGQISSTSLSDVGDTVPPFVYRVAGVTNPPLHTPVGNPPIPCGGDGCLESGSPGMLTTATTGQGANDIQIFFDEALSPTSAASSVQVTARTIGAGACGSSDTETLLPSTATFASSTQLNIDTTNPLPAGKQICIYLPVGSFTDLAGNFLTSGLGVGFDSLVTNDVILTLQTPLPSNTSLTAVTHLQQVTTPVQSSSDPLFASSDAFVSTTAADVDPNGTDICDGGNICQLNQDDAGIGLGGFGSFISPTVNALGDLSTALGFGTSVFVNQARVTFNTSGATDYVVAVTRGDTVLNGGAVLTDPSCSSGFGPPGTIAGENSNTHTVSCITLSPPFGDGSTSEVVIKPSAEGVMDLRIGGVRPGDFVNIIPRGDINGDGVGDIVDPNAVATLQLMDHVPPTTVVQGVTASAIAASAPGSGIGGGGTAVIPGSSLQAGTPYLFITPQTADVDDNTPASYFSDNWCGPDEITGKSNAAVLRAGFQAALPFLGISYNSSTGCPHSSFFGVDLSLADATGAMAFVTNTPARIGIAVSEPLSTTAAQPLPVAGRTGDTLTSVFSDPQVINDTVDEDGNLINLYTVKVSNVFDLQTDAQKGDVPTYQNPFLLSLTGLVDANGVMADAATRAQVGLVDVMPPVMTRAFFDGTNVVFQFNEAIDPNQGSTPNIVMECTVLGSIAAALADPTNPATLSSDGKTLTVPRVNTAWSSPPTSTCFHGPDTDSGTPALEALAYAESAYTAANLGTLTVLAAGNIQTTPDHGFVLYGGVSDLSGNWWSGWLSLTDPNTGNDFGIGGPRFDRQHREHAGHQIEDQATEQREDQRQPQSDLVRGRRWHQGRRLRGGQRHGRHRAGLGMDLPGLDAVAVVDHQHAVHLRRSLDVGLVELLRQAQLAGRIVVHPLRGGMFDQVIGVGKELDVASRELGAFYAQREIPAADGEAHFPVRRRGLRKFGARLGKRGLRARIRGWRAARRDDRQSQGKLGRTGNAHVLAHQPARFGARGERLADRPVRRHMQCHRQQRFAVVAVVDDVAEDLAMRIRPLQRSGGDARRQIPVQRGRQSGVARIAPIDVPARLRNDAQGELVVGARDQALVFRHQLGGDVLGAHFVGGRGQQRGGDPQSGIC
ncbi:MAG: Ig-like domain-containing protein [Sinobacteraceae bacterium]|nr:Ig-like domain-containing protein [Nevskiaceae bacterium]